MSERNKREDGFAGLAAGDRWCLCALRWKEALEAGSLRELDAYSA
ncbi:MAG: DUF2237 family protein [Spirochaetales bacterium]